MSARTLDSPGLIIHASAFLPVLSHEEQRLLFPLRRVDSSLIISSPFMLNVILLKTVEDVLIPKAFSETPYAVLIDTSKLHSTNHQLDRFHVHAHNLR